jgi:hemolysin activation/secretion protein
VFGRAFDPSELLGDHCIMASGELRYDLPNSLEGQLPQGEFNPVPSMQLFGFADWANLYRIAVAAVGTEAKIFAAASAGGGIRLGWADRLNIDLTAAKAIEGPRNDWRFFFITSSRY